MLNIVMNSPDAELGPELAKFKESSRDLSSVLRGYELSRHAFLRGVHNSFSRRMDQLNEDLLLENEASNNAKSNKRSRATKSRARARKGPAARSQTSFHFVAYVPVDGRVWELDGLRGAPRSIGVADPADWTSVARDHIQARMLQYADDPDGCAFNLLALCRSPLQAIARRVAEHLATLQRLRSIIRSRPDLVDAVDLSDSIRFSLDDDNAADEILSEFHLTMGDIEAASVQDLPEEQSANAAAAQELHDSLVVSIKATMGEYRSELLASADGQQRVAGRKNDYGPALHKWVSILAEKNALLGLVKQHDPAK